MAVFTAPAVPDLAQSITAWFLEWGQEDDWYDAKTIRAGLFALPVSLDQVVACLDQMVAEHLMAKRIGKYGPHEVLYDLPGRVWRDRARREEEAQALAAWLQAQWVKHPYQAKQWIDRIPGKGPADDCKVCGQDSQYPAHIIIHEVQRSQDGLVAVSVHPDTPGPGESLSGPWDRLDREVKEDRYSEPRGDMTERERMVQHLYVDHDVPIGWIEKSSNDPADRVRSLGELHAFHEALAYSTGDCPGGFMPDPQAEEGRTRAVWAGQPEPGGCPAVTLQMFIGHVVPCSMSLDHEGDHETIDWTSPGGQIRVSSAKWS